MRTLPQETVYKVAMAIPNEGHTLPEPYDNHLIQATRLGAYEAQQRADNRYVKIREAVRQGTDSKTYKALGFDEKVKFHKVRFEFYWHTVGRLLTQLAREKLAQMSLQSGMDFILMYDDDMMLPPDMGIKLLEDMVAHPEIDVLAPLAFMRNPPHYAVIYTVTEGYDPVEHTEFYFREFVKRYPRNQLVECDAVGFGAACIRTSLLKKMKAPYFMSTTGTGEDIWFCYQAKKRYGARIFMDTRIKLGHMKNPEVVDEEYFDKWTKENKHDLGEEIPGKWIALEK